MPLFLHFLSLFFSLRPNRNAEGYREKIEEENFAARVEPVCRASKIIEQVKLLRIQVEGCNQSWPAIAYRL